jgi:tripartite-type tricarboxylate transporter receptor subunit TctC
MSGKCHHHAQRQRNQPAHHVLGKDILGDADCECNAGFLQYECQRRREATSMSQRTCYKSSYARFGARMSRRHQRVTHAALLAVISIACVIPVASAQDIGSFFAGRQARIIVGTGAGRGYDAYARLVARHLGKHVAGRPTFIVENMPGASGIRAINYLYSAAPNDGTVIATFNNAIPFYQAVGQPGIRFKAEELSWIGSLAQAATVVAVWHAAGVRTIDDARRVEVVMGATGAAGTKAAYPALLNNTLGTKFKIVTGYEGGNAVTLAIERGEVQGDGSSRWSSWKATRPAWVGNRKIIPVVQMGLRKDAELPEVALLTDYAQSEEQRQMFELVGAPDSLGQPFAGPPRIPADRLTLLRRAFDQMLRDPAFRAEAATAKLDVDPLAGEETQNIVKLIVGTPPAIIHKVQAATIVKNVAKFPVDGANGDAQ